MISFNLLGREILGAQIWIDVGLLEDAPGRAQADAVNVS